MPSQTATIAVVFGLSWVAHFGPVVVAIKLSQDVVVKSEAGFVASPRIGSNSVSGDAVADRVSDTVGGSFCDDGFHIQCFLAGQRQHEGRDPECGDHDDEDFTAADSCCTCGGGETYECTDTTNGGALQSSFPPNTGQPGCKFIVSRKWWEAKHGRCADFASAKAWVKEEEYDLAYDDEDFTAQDMCCACGGGARAAPATAAPAPTSGPPTPGPPTPAPTSAPTAASVSAKGDPHLVNMYGQRFDLYQEGIHTLLLIPRFAQPEETLLRVEADAQRMGAACSDLYFQVLNITGHWSDLHGGFHFCASAGPSHMDWRTFGTVDLKVIGGVTVTGIKYLNILVRHLKGTRYPIGGLLGGDHMAAGAPDNECSKVVSLSQKTRHHQSLQ